MSEFEVKPEWYERLREDERFPGRTFTADNMMRIERQALQRRRFLWRRASVWSAVLVAVCASLLLIIGKYAHFTQDPVIGSPSASAPLSSPLAEDRYYLKGEAQATELAQPFSAVVSVFAAKPDRTYAVVDTDGEFARIVADDGQTGWIPKWYLTREPADRAVIEQLAEPYVLLVDKPVSIRLYPEEASPSGFELWEGKVVQVVQELGDWVAVNIVTYDSPYAGDKWLRKSELAVYDGSKAREGYVFFSAAGGTDDPQVKLYDESGKLQQELPGFTTLYIEGEQDGRYRVIASGGRSGYIDKADFIPNPFAFELVDQ